MMTAQQIYDRVKRRLLRQGAKSVNGADCKYRNRDGHKCAAGHLIKDENYVPDCEGSRVSQHLDVDGPGRAIVLQSLAESGVDIGYVELIADLQNVHDQSSVDRWEPTLADVARKWGLTP